MTQTRLLRFVDWSAERGPVPIYTAEPVRPIEPDWLAIAHYPDSPESSETFCLYFLTRAGEMLESIQCDSLEIALDAALSLVNLSHGDWTSGDVPFPDDRLIPYSIVQERLGN